MLTLLRRTLPAALAAGLLAIPTVRAEEPKKDAEKKDSLSAIEAIETAQKLAVFGRTTKTPEALATAALMIAKTSIDPDDLPTDKQDGTEVVKYDQEADIKGLLAEASKMAPENKAVAEIKDTVKGMKRGATTGAQTIIVNIKPGATYRLLRTFNGGGSVGKFCVTVKDPAPQGSYSTPPQWIAVSVTNQNGKPLPDPEGDGISKPHNAWDAVSLRWSAASKEQAVCVVTNLRTDKTIQVAIWNN